MSKQLLVTIPDLHFGHVHSETKETKVYLLPKDGPPVLLGDAIVDFKIEPLAKKDEKKNE